jgi:elongation factor G
MVDYLPAADRINETARLNGAEVEDQRPPADGPLAAFAFKTLADPHVGRVTYLRVLSGTLKSNSHVVNATRGESERIGQLFYVRGKEHINTDAIGAGDIGAVSKLASTMTGDTLADEACP